MHDGELKVRFNTMRDSFSRYALQSRSKWLNKYRLASI
jgi:hypothetical protein